MAWSLTTRSDNYVHGTETGLVVPDSGGASETSVNSTALPVDVSNHKFYVEVTVTETCAGDGALSCRLQSSHDGGTTWVTRDTATMDVDPTGANSDNDDLDASAWYFSDWRIQVFSDGTDTVDDCTVTLEFLALPLEVRTGAKKH